MSSAVTKKVNDLKESLIKHQSSSSEEKEAILDVLSNLDQCSIDVNVLASTLIGATVSKFKSNSDGEVVAKAKYLIKKWKQIAKQSGVGSSSKKNADGNNNAMNGSAEKKRQSLVSKPSSSTSSMTNGTSSDSKPSASSTSSTSSSSATTVKSVTAWDHLPSNRKNSAMKLYETFILSSSSQRLKTEIEINDDSPTVSSTMINQATKVEEAIQTYSKNKKKLYIEKIRSLVFNLKKNAPLRENVILNTTTPQTLVNMTSKELQTIEKAKECSKLTASLQGSRRLDWEQANAAKVNEMCGIKGELLKASLFTCGRCKSHKTTSTQKQTRSADEPMTVFVFCENCGNRWKC